MATERAPKVGLVRRFARVLGVRGFQPDDAESCPDRSSSTGDVLAEKLLAVQRVLATLDADSETRIRLNVRFMAICTSLKMPGASPLRGIRRLDKLMADAEFARGGPRGGPGGEV